MEHEEGNLEAVYHPESTKRGEKLGNPLSGGFILSSAGPQQEMGDTR